MGDDKKTKKPKNKALLAMQEALQKVRGGKAAENRRGRSGEEGKGEKGGGEKRKGKAEEERPNRATKSRGNFLDGEAETRPREGHGATGSPQTAGCSHPDESRNRSRKSC